MQASLDDLGVLLVAEEGEREAVVDALAGIAPITTATTVEGVRDRLDGVGCAVVAGPIGDADGIAVVEAIHDGDPDLPIVFAPREGSESLAVRATTAGATTYLPRTEGAEALREHVRAALAAGVRRRRHRRNGTALESMLSEVPVTLFAKDEDARHVMLSDSLEGSDPGEAIGATDAELYGDDPVHARNAYEDDLEVIETGEPIVGQVEKIDAQDYTAWIETSKVPWRDADGEIRGLVGIARDVTERKEYEHELRRERARAERFANYIAHDLRNPLNVARGYLELARDTGDVDPLDDVEGALDRIEEVIDDVLALVGEDESEPPLTQVAVHDQLQNAWESVDTRSATLVADVPREAVLVAGRSHLQELFENLLRNAVEHGGSDVTIRVGLLEDGFYVEDDGPGIPEAEREAVLEYGYTTDEEGTGLGLAVVAELAEVYDWTVEVTESADGGARFEFHDCLLVADPPSDVTAGERVRIRTSRDVGDPTPAGEAEQSGETWVVRGAGEDVWSDTNECHFAGAELDGDGRITARLTALEEVDPYTKAGVMIRDGFEESDPLGYVGMTAEHGTEALWRPTARERTGHVPIDIEAEEPHWFRAERSDDRVTVSISADGESWTHVDQRRVDLGETVLAGLAVCSHRDGTLAEARFDEVAVETLAGE